MVKELRSFTTEFVLRTNIGPLASPKEQSKHEVSHEKHHEYTINQKHR